MVWVLVLVAWALGTLVGAFVTFYLGGYLKRKGENLATHEDIDKLVAQVSAVTQTTKEIEAKISGELWDRQKRWEMKREALFGAMRRASDLQNDLRILYSVYHTDKKAGVERPDARLSAYTKFNETSSKFHEAIFVAGLACGKAVERVLLDFNLFAQNISVRIIGGRPEAFEESVNELVSKLDAITTAIRKDMGTNSSTEN